MGKSSAPKAAKAEPWEPAQGQLKDILGLAKEVYQNNGGLSPEAIQREIPGLTPEMAKSLQALADSGQLGSIADNLSKFTGSAGDDLSAAEQMAKDFSKQDFSVTGNDINKLSSQLYDNELVRSQKEQLAKDADEQYGLGVNQLNRQAGGSGNMGNSRAGVAQGVMYGKTQDAIAKGSADVMNSARSQALGAATTTLGQNMQNKLNQYTQGMNTLGTLGTNLSGQYIQSQTAAAGLYDKQMQNQYTAAQQTQNMQNAQQETKYQNALAQKNAAQDNLNNYLNTVGKVGGLGGTQTGGAGADAGPSKAQAAIGGAMSGAAAGATIGSVVPGVGTAIGAVAGGVIGGASGYFSDATLKKDVKIKGKTKKGEAVYDWNWNEKGKSKGMKGKASGVLAQNMMKDKPSAVGKKDGALMVDYDQTSVKPKQKKSKK